MPFIEWSKELETGHRDIDKDHQGLFAIVNDLYDKVSEGFSEASLDVTLQALVAYIDVHFDREESLMVDSGYEEIERHKLAHNKLADQVRTYAKLFKDDPRSIEMSDFMAFLADWLSNHILKTDMEMAKSIKHSISEVHK